jgi:imidazole glycerol-phosphate synthase subunit HisH
MIVIVDYGSGNISAIANCLRKRRIAHQISRDHNIIEQSDSLVLAGVGSFDQTMKLLKNNGLYNVLDDQVIGKGKKVLGVCVGMQVMGDSSEEGDMEGFGWIPGSVQKLVFDPGLKPSLPHMGWNSVAYSGSEALFKNINNDVGFYFLHSYYFNVCNVDHVIASVDYGTTFPCAVHKGNIYGTQFHPEKSHSNGAQLLQNFADLSTC